MCLLGSPSARGPGVSSSSPTAGVWLWPDGGGDGVGWRRKKDAPGAPGETESPGLPSGPSELQLSNLLLYALLTPEQGGSQEGEADLSAEATLSEVIREQKQNSELYQQKSLDSDSGGKCLL